MPDSTIKDRAKDGDEVRKGVFSSRQRAASQEKRRKEFLRRQKTLREELVKKARCLASFGEESEAETEVKQAKKSQCLTTFGEEIEGETIESSVTSDDAMEMEGEEQDTQTAKKKKSKKNKKKEEEKLKKMKQKFCRMFREHLQEPEWMVEVPCDLKKGTEEDDMSNACLESNWVVLPRPEGQRCMLLAKGNCTLSIAENGRIMHSFKSWLPGGGGNRAQGLTILDCIYCSENDTYFILDLLFWNDLSYYQCDAGFRFHWIRSKYEELSTCTYSQRVLQLLPVFDCTQTGLEQAYSIDMMESYHCYKNGLLFFHKEGHYELGTLTPLVLVWKDSQTCRYCKASSTEEEMAQQQSVLLRVEKAVGEQGCCNTSGNEYIEMVDCYYEEQSIESIDTETFSKENCDENSAYWLISREGYRLHWIPSCSSRHDLSNKELRIGDHVRGKAKRVGYTQSPEGNCVPSIEEFVVCNVIPKDKSDKYCDSWSKILFKHMLSIPHGESNIVTIFDIADQAP